MGGFAQGMMSWVTAPLSRAISWPELQRVGGLSPREGRTRFLGNALIAHDELYSQLFSLAIRG